MKFIIPVRSWSKGPVLDLEGSARGPFATVEAVDAYAAEAWPNDKERSFLVVEGEIRTVPPSPLEKPESEKRAPGDERNWRKVRGAPSRWECKTCGATIMAVQVAHPIWDGPFPASGSGECSYEEVGYCPNCEKKPNASGAPVTP